MGKQKTLIWGVRIGVPILLIVFIIMGIGFYSSGSSEKGAVKMERHGNTDAPENIKEAEKIIATLYMPDLVGASEEGAIKKLSDMGFYNVKTTHEESSCYEKGFVFQQSIPANVTVGTNYEITLHIAD